MQHGDRQVNEEEPPGQGQVAPPRGPFEEHAPEDRGPEPVAERSEDATQNLGVDEAEQRQAARREEGAEGVATALEGRETGADGGAEDDPVPYPEVAQTPADEDQRQ